LTYYLLRKRLSWLKFGDVIVPCLFIGLAFGRLGCLMNGCCYGGRCDESAYALHFPPSSPVYEVQIRSGELLGFCYDATTREIQQVMPGSLAEKAGIQVGARLETLAEDLTSIDSASRLIPSEAARLGVVATIDGRRYRWSPEELPPRALPVFPVQLISSVTALLLCLSLCGLSLWPLRDGMIMMVGFAGYAVLRFLVEIMRVDEGGQFGTNLSISQWVSLVVFSCAMFGIGWLFFAHPSKPTSTRALSGN
jgi:phosphatidylglycerol:prolipoprotein diacylglycerol transferase